MDRVPFASGGRIGVHQLRAYVLLPSFATVPDLQNLRGSQKRLVCAVFYIVPLTLESVFVLSTVKRTLSGCCNDNAGLVDLQVQYR